MTDHATWVSFTTAETEALRRILFHTELTSDEQAQADVASISSRLDQYEAPEAKNPAFREAAGALEFVRDGECEIDDHAVVSGSDEGAYVMAWVWVSNEDAGVETDG